MQEDSNADDAPLYLLYIVQMFCLGHIQVLVTPPYVPLSFPIYNTDIPISSWMNDSRDQILCMGLWSEPTHDREL